MSGEDLPLPEGWAARAWQAEAVPVIRRALAQYQSVIASVATGCGKSAMIGAIAVLAARKGGRVLVLAHRDELVRQIPDHIAKIPGAPSCGVVQATRNEAACPIVSASVASLHADRLAAIMDATGGWDLIITDEAHHATAPIYRRIYDANRERKPRYRHIGVTATPFRSGPDGTTSGLGEVFDAVVYEYGIADAIAAGDLVPIRALQVSTQLDLSGVRVGADGDFVGADLSTIVNCEARNELVVDKYREHCMGAQALAFAASIDHAKDLAKAFYDRQIQARAVWGTDPHRAVKIDAYLKGKIQVLVSKDLLFEGFNAPNTRAVLKARPTKSRGLFTQMVGRGTRTHPGKTDCLFIDFVDNGCELDLATVADLSDSPEEDPTPIREGDWVRRKHHADWGKGRVKSINGDNAFVQWPISHVHRTGSTRTHSLIELTRCRPDDSDATKPEPIQIQPRIAGVQEYQITLLPRLPGTTGAGGTSTAGHPVAWYEYQGGYSASGRFSDGATLALYVMRENAKSPWEIWSRLSRRDGSDWHEEIAALDQAEEIEAALRRGEDWLEEMGARIDRFAADWQTDPATDRQIGALRKWGIRRSTARMSKGEAKALLDAVVSRRRVLEYRRLKRG